MFISKFKYFFDCCVGTWVAQRTYHDLTHQQVERSRTQFTIEQSVWRIPPPRSGGG
ncbi:phycobiliprotein lyase [Moorena sp. SIO4G3]|uniref:phycobiliprotein lyase n=1 Tax=Moorena sp. SIO4G3 TaxID=2607821 RepID=UPI0025E7A5A9|nr:phycobiliprotein lyase [Moorena sp. SIO4G3]